MKIITEKSDVMLSNYRIQKYGRCYIVTDHNYTQFSTLFSNRPHGIWEKQNRREKELLSFMTRTAILFFHKHNIIVRWINVENEIDQFFREIAEVFLYKCSGIDDDRIPVEDIGLTICCDRKPHRLIGYLKKGGFHLMEPFTGVYYLSRAGITDVQIVIVNSANESECVWIDYVFPIRGKAVPALTM